MVQTSELTTQKVTTNGCWAIHIYQMRGKQEISEIKETLLVEGSIAGVDQRNIINWLCRNPHGGVITPDFKPIPGVDDVVAWALDAVAGRRKHRNTTTTVITHQVG